MCGINCVLTTDPGGYQFPDQLSHFLERRGPDGHGMVTKVVRCSKEQGKYEEDGSSNGTLHFFGYTLHLRGQLTVQPSQDSCGNVLLWNGEIFAGDIKVQDDENDGQVLLGQLQMCDTQEEILTTMSKVKGPWSFIYWQKAKALLWFGRDFLGRRSLLWHLSSDCKTFALSSVALRSRENDQIWEEVPATGTYCIDLSCTQLGKPSSEFHIKCFNWQQDKPLSQDLSTKLEKHDVKDAKIDTANHIKLNVKPVFPIVVTCLPSESLKCPFGLMNQTLVCDIKVIPSKSSEQGDVMQSGLSDVMQCGLSDELAVIDDDLRLVVTEFIKVLEEGVRRRVVNVPYRYCVHEHKHRRSNNMRVGSSSLDMSELQLTLDGVNATKVTTGSSKTIPTNKMNSHSVPLCQCTCHKKEHMDSPTSADKVLATIEDPDISFPRISRNTDCYHSDASVAILFSGGIDSMVIAALTDRILLDDNTIDLLNVAFEQKPKTGSKSKDSSQNGNNSSVDLKWDPFSTPDRITSRSGLKELQSLNPNRKWNLIEINVSAEELQQMRSEVISDLVYPLTSVLDDSIGCALWFAARGVGTIQSMSGDSLSDGMGYSCKSVAKVVLSGLGADEQLAGYSRHRTEFKKHGWAGLLSQLEMEIGRLSSRNLGRDDRVISDHGREARFPFLDEDVVDFLNKTPLHIKANLTLPRGVGEKRLLRIAAGMIGLTGSCRLPKRAIQFGSRIAKLENSSQKATDICERLLLT